MIRWTFSDHAKAAIREADQAASVDQSRLAEVVQAGSFHRARGRMVGVRHTLPTLVVAEEEREERVAVGPDKPEEEES